MDMVSPMYSKALMIDSGASEHIIRHLKEYFSNHTELTVPKMVIVGNGAKICAIGIRKTPAEAFNDKIYLKPTVWSLK